MVNNKWQWWCCFLMNLFWRSVQMSISQEQFSTSKKVLGRKCAIFQNGITQNTRIQLVLWECKGIPFAGFQSKRMSKKEVNSWRVKVRGGNKMGTELEIAGNGWELLAARMARLKEQCYAVMNSPFVRRNFLYVCCIYFPNQKLAYGLRNMSILMDTMGQTDMRSVLNIWLLLGNGLFLKEPNISMAKELHSFTITS